MSEEITEALLEAGAVTPVGTPLGERRDALTARAYQHRALDGRTVVRLAPAKLGLAEDLTMSFLGFGEPSEAAEVGVVRQQALGFPAWALVHDPANGHHALALVKDIEKISRRAKSKPGNAKDGFDALARPLEVAVPHFLPTFYEQAARAFLAVENTTYASSYFTRAREAEKAYGLAVDEDAQAASFLEFALAGALSAKSLTAYAKALAERCTPQEAYARFKRICIERVAGGLPPYTAMPKDLKRLAKAAKLDTVAEDAAVAVELLPLAATGKAASGFWTTYKPILVAAGKADPRVRGLMLALLPTMGSELAHVADHIWLGILEDSGATAGLTEPVAKLAPEELPADGASGWLNRFVRHANRSNHWRHYRSAKDPVGGLIPLVGRMAARLQAENAELVLCEWDRADIDLIDLCLSLGLRVSDPAKPFGFALAEWLQRDQVRDLAAFVADARFRPRVRQALVQLTGESADLDTTTDTTLLKLAPKVVAAAGLRSVLRDVLATFAEKTVAAGFADLDRYLGLWLHLGAPELQAVNPEAFQRVLDLDVAPYLGHALRAGVFDEYGWPELERACAKLAPEKQDKQRGWALISQWPYLIVREGREVAVVGHEGIVLEHRLQLPAQNTNRNEHVHFVDGQLLVSWFNWRNSGGYWSDDPALVFTDQIPPHVGRVEDSLPLPGGGRSFGGRPLMAGATSWTTGGMLASDGERFWIYEHLDGTFEQRPVPRSWHEFEPIEGKRGAVSLPKFFEQGEGAGSTLLADQCWMVPAPAGLEHSPLGVADGLLGARLRRQADGTVLCSRIDGREVAIPRSQYAWSNAPVYGLLDAPGKPAAQAVFIDQKIHLVADGSRRTARLTCGAQRATFARGTSVIPPFRYWSLLSVRDEAGSAALRETPDTLAADLLHAGVADPEAVLEAVAEHLPQVTHVRLREGVAGYVDVAADCVRRIEKLRVRLTVGDPKPAPRGPQVPWDTNFFRIRNGVVNELNSHMSAPQRWDVLAAVRDLGRALTAEPWDEQTRKLAGSHQQMWNELIEVLLRIPALALRAVSPAFGDEARTAMLTVLAEIDSSGLAAPVAAVRRVELTPEDAKAAWPPYAHGFETAHGRVLLLGTNESRNGVKTRLAFEFSRDGQFEAVPGWKIVGEGRAVPWAWQGTLGRFVELARERGPITPDPEAADRLSEMTGLSLLSARNVLTGLPTLAYENNEKFPAELLTLLGAKQTELFAAGRRFESHRLHPVPAGWLLSRLLPPTPEALWESGLRTETVGEVWVKQFGRLEPLPEWLRELAARESGPSLVQGLLSLNLRAAFGAEDATVRGELAGAVGALVWLAYALPVGDPLRARLPQALDLLRRHVAAPDYSAVVAGLSKEDVPPLMNLLGLELVEANGNLSAGPLQLSDQHGWWWQIRLRPSLLRGPDDPVLRYFAEPTPSQQPDVVALSLILGKEIDRLLTSDPDAPGTAAEPGTTTPYAAQDPTRSVPDLVAEVAARHALSEDAAALYLMVLALPDPTDRNQARWLGWKPARLKAARTELAATDLVVNGARPRAGRTLFLPGPWHALASPHLPLESWKCASLGVSDEGRVQLGRALPRIPVTALYRAAWQRILDGDAPRYEELASPRGRR
jgi:hypothetical protein